MPSFVLFQFVMAYFDLITNGAFDQRIFLRSVKKRKRKAYPNGTPSFGL